MNTSDIKQRFDNEIGEEYDLFQLASPYHDEIQNEVAKVLKNNLPNKEKLTVMEIGFGTAITSKIILSLDERIKLLGVDNVEKMLLKAQNYLSSFNSDRYKLFINDALDFLKDIPENSIDAVVSVWVLHNLEKNHRLDVLKEIFRVLKSEGIFINGDKIADADPKKHQQDYEWQLKQFDVFETINRPELKKEWIEHYDEDEKVDKILLENEFENDLKSLGFSKPQLVNRKFMDAVIFAKK